MRSNVYTKYGITDPTMVCMEPYLGGTDPQVEKRKENQCYSNYGRYGNLTRGRILSLVKYGRYGSPTRSNVIISTVTTEPTMVGTDPLTRR